MVSKRVRVWTSGRSPPYKALWSAPPPGSGKRWWVLGHTRGLVTKTSCKHGIHKGISPACDKPQGQLKSWDRPGGAGRIHEFLGLLRKCHKTYGQNCTSLAPPPTLNRCHPPPLHWTFYKNNNTSKTTDSTTFLLQIFINKIVHKWLLNTKKYNNVSYKLK